MRYLVATVEETVHEKEEGMGGKAGTGAIRGG